MILLAGYYIAVLAILLLVPQKRSAIISALLLSFLISALRFNAGYDYFSYMTIIEAGDFRRFEPMNVFLMELAKGVDVYLYFIVTSAVTCLFMGLALLKGVDRYNISRISLLAFVALPVGLIESFGMVRQFCAAAILLYAFMSRDNWKIWVPLCIVAPLFHISAVIWIPVVVAFPCLKVRFSRPIYFGVLAISPFVGTALRILAESLDFYSHYFQTQVSGFGQKIGLMFALLVVALVVKSGRVRDLQPQFNVFFIATCLYLALAPYGANIARGAWYGLMLYPILIGALLRHAGWEKIAAVVVLTLAFGSHFYFDRNNGYWQPISNYQLSPFVSESERKEWIVLWKNRVDDPS